MKPDSRLRRTVVTILTCVATLAVLSAIKVRVQVVEDHEKPPATPAIPFASLVDGVQVVQEFVARGAGIQSIDLEIGTHSRFNNGELSLQVAALNDGERRELGEAVLHKGELRNDEYNSFVFKPSLVTHKGQLLAFSLRGSGSPATAVTWYVTPGWLLPGHRLLLNGQEVAATGHFRVHYRTVTGRLAGRGLRPFWQRLNVLLSPLGKVLLVGGACLALFAFVHLILWHVLALGRRSDP